VKLREELALGELPGQQISLEPFLPTAVRKASLLDYGNRPDKFLAFLLGL
jgi:hypothetical protein